MQRVGGPFPEECRRMDCGEGDVWRGGRVGMLRECIVHVGVEVVDWWVGDGTTTDLRSFLRLGDGVSRFWRRYRMGLMVM